MSEMPAARPDVPEWDIADRVRKSLRRARLGVQDIADYLEVSRTTVSNWINGRIEPSAQTMRLIAMRCGVNYEWLRTGHAPPVENNAPNADPGASALVSHGSVLTYIGAHKRTRIATVTPLLPPIGAHGPWRRNIA